MLYTGISSSRRSSSKSTRSSISESSVVSGSDISAPSSYGKNSISSSSSSSLGKKLSANSLLPANTLGFPSARPVVNSLPAIGSKATLQLLSSLKTTTDEGDEGGQPPRTDNFKVMMKSLSSSYSVSDERALPPSTSTNKSSVLGESSFSTSGNEVYTSSAPSNSLHQYQQQQQFDPRYGYQPVQTQTLSSPTAFSPSVIASPLSPGGVIQSQVIQPPPQFRQQAVVPQYMQSLVSQQIQQQQQQQQQQQRQAGWLAGLQ
jgi:hypothetical protein